jgi:hypothetical protein
MLKDTLLEVGGFQSNQATSAMVMRDGANFATRRRDAKEGESSRNQIWRRNGAEAQFRLFYTGTGYIRSDVTR